jgi:hypothetical protein
LWRCWGSNWIAEKEGCIVDLLRTLKELEIEPLDAELLQGSWTEFRGLKAEASRTNPIGANQPVLRGHSEQAC